MNDAEIAKRHRYGYHSLILLGGPYHMHIAHCDGSMPYMRLPAEPGVNMDGSPSACAPLPTSDGSVVYDNTGKRNVFGSMRFRFREGD